MEGYYKELVVKLNSFIRIYYYNLLIKGVLFFVGGFALVVAIVSLLEFYGYFNSLTRTILFYSFVFFNGFLFIRYLVIPLMGLLKLGKSLTHDEAAVILGKFFRAEVDDKIINTIQLQRLIKSEPEKSEILIASIEQKSFKFLGFCFEEAVNLKRNWRYFPITALISAILLSGWVFLPFVFKDSFHRIIKYDTHFQRPAPFDMIIKNEIPLKAFKGESFLLELEVVGSVLPSEIYVESDRARYRMISESINNFSYEFKNLTQNVPFYLEANGFIFGPYSIHVQGKAIFKSIILKADFPAYTGIDDAIFSNVSDVSLAEGSTLEWRIKTEEAKAVRLTINEMDSIILVNDNIVSFIYELNKDIKIGFTALEDSLTFGEFINYEIKAIRDIHPQITLEQIKDSMLTASYFFRGLISDDYGFSRLSFLYRIFDEENSDIILRESDFLRKEIDFDGSILMQGFTYSFNFLDEGLLPGKTFEYFFEVTDNDRVNGSKSTRSGLYKVTLERYDQLISKRMEDDKMLKDGLSRNVNEINSIQKELDKLRKEMLESENVTWEQRENLKNLLDKQKNAFNVLEQLQREANEIFSRNKEFEKGNEEILRKQDELQKLFEDVLSDELKDLFNKIQEELEKLSRDEAFQMLERMQMELQDFENRLDRALELFKRLQVENLLQEGIDYLDRISRDQEELNDRISDNGLYDRAMEDQERIKSEFEFLEKLIDEINEKNQELLRPNELDDTSEIQKDIENSLGKAIENMERSNINGTKNSQNDISKNMGRLSEALNSMKMKMQQQNLAEDVRVLREILDNLLKTSFNQENLMKRTGEISLRDPEYLVLIQEQRKIKDDLNTIKDSLIALSKRQIQIESFVSRELTEIGYNIENSIDHLINRRKQTGIMRQQYVMTHTNNLALLLNESLQNMQAMMQAMSSGDPMQGDNGEMSFGDLRQMQEEMNQMLEKLQQGHQSLPGGLPGNGDQGLSESLARMAAEQETIRKSLQEIMQQSGAGGEDKRNLEEIMNEMVRTELDIVTNNISRRTFLRQQNILTRLLEHEKAELQREVEEKRLGNTAKFYDLSNPDVFFEYNRLMNQEIESIKSLPVSLKPHYKSVVKKYLLNFD